MLPRYSDPLGVYSTLPLLPPFFFQGMTARVFPLRASPFQIDVLCKTYINFIPPDLGRFRAFMPFVFLMVLDYGKLAAPVANVGWLSQYEIMFAVPVEWYRQVDGKWEFVNWTWLTPFIYVDSELSLLLGRQTYGWPKSLMQFTPAMSHWMNDPTAPVRRATVSAMVLPELFVGDRQASRVIMEIQQEGGLLSSKFPPDLQSPLMPWTALGNAVKTSASMMSDLASILMGMGFLRAQPGASPENYLRMLAVAAEMMNPYDPQIVFNTLNLKQFRDSRRPGNYCYQSLTNAPMLLRQVNAIGLLGDVNQLAGDATGGIRIDLYEWPGYPIVEMLGLEVARRWRGDGVDIAQLEPVFPFWYDVDMIYGRGQNVAWRTFDALWHAPDGSLHPPVPPVPGARSDRELESRYNSTLGVSASQPAAGVFSFTGSTIRVLPLLAEKAKLQAFLDAYLNEPLAESALTSGERFEVWGSPGDEPYACVYMLATNYGTMVSPEANIGSWQSESLSILVPVAWMREENGKRELRGLGAVPAYTFTNSNEAVISSAEVLGIPMTKGVFVSPPNTWMSNKVTLSANQPLLRISAEVLPAVDLGQKAESRQIIGIAKGPILDAADADSWGRMAASPVWQVYEDHVRRAQARAKKLVAEEKAGDGEGKAQTPLKDTRALALELLAHEAPLCYFTLKQFRDVASPQDACYQSVVRTANVITRLYDLREIEDNIHVEIREYPTLPIMRMLGLLGHLSADQCGGGVVYKLLPIRPFWARIAWRQELGEQLWYRCGSTEWQSPPGAGSLPPARPVQTSCFAPGSVSKLPLRTMGELLDTSDPGDLEVLLQDSHDVDLKDERPLTGEEAAAAVRQIDPQLVIGSILSREWGHTGEDARWRSRQREYAAQLTREIETSPTSRQQAVMVAFFERLRDEIVRRYQLGQKSSWFRRMTAEIRELESFEELVSNVDDLYDKLAVAAGGEARGKADGHVRQLVEEIFKALEATDEGHAHLVHPSDRRLRRALRDKLDHLVGAALESLAPNIWERMEAELAATSSVAAATEGEYAKTEGEEATSEREYAKTEGEEAAPMGDEEELAVLWEWFCKSRPQLRDVLQHLRHECERRRQCLLVAFSKAAQKPDVCTLRDIAGPHAERIFPLQASWDERWFTGWRDDPRRH